MKVNGQLEPPAALPPGHITPYHYVGKGVGPMDDLNNTKISWHCQESYPDSAAIQPRSLVAIMTKVTQFQPQFFSDFHDS
jgi:hypothetical protein